MNTFQRVTLALVAFFLGFLAAPFWIHYFRMYWAWVERTLQ